MILEIAKGRKAALKAKRDKKGVAAKKSRTKRDQALKAGLVQSFKDAEDVIAEEIRQGAYQPGDTESEEDE
jgi:hypothetical protein